MKPREVISETLVSYGFTELEAQIYVYLLENSPATGYKIAKGIGRSFTNTYKAQENLLRKGAVILEDSQNKMFRSLPLDEVLEVLDNDLKARRKDALKAAAGLSKMIDDDRIYHLSTPEQVYERFRSMLNDCKERALIEAFPVPLTEVKKDVEKASKRGIIIASRVYGNEAFTGSHIIRSPYAEDYEKKWHYQWLSLYVDGRQFLMATFNRDGTELSNAVWSENLHLAREIYSYVNSDFHHYSFINHLDQCSTIDQLREAYRETQTLFPVGGDLGMQDLFGKSTNKESE